MAKTLFDPCPEGWRVPWSGSEASGRSPWRAFTLDNSAWNGNPTDPTGGRTWKSTVVFGGTGWYPAPGFRDAGNYSLFGKLGSGGGYSWSSAVSGTYGLYLSMDSTWVDPSNTNSRGLGFSIRCIRE